MPKGTIKLKKPAPPKKRSTKRIELLPADVRADIEGRLERHERLEDIAAAIHEEWGELLDLSRSYVEQIISAYRDGPLRARIIARGVGVADGATTHVVMARVNAMTEMEELCRVQLTRIAKVRKTEADMPLTMKSVSDEIKLGVTMLARLGHLQLETGYLARAPRFAAPGDTDKDGTVPVSTWDNASEALLAQLKEETGG